MHHINLGVFHSLFVRLAPKLKAFFLFTFVSFNILTRAVSRTSQYLLKLIMVSGALTFNQHTFTTYVSPVAFTVRQRIVVCNIMHSCRRSCETTPGTSGNCSGGYAGCTKLHKKSYSKSLHISDCNIVRDVLNFTRKVTERAFISATVTL